MAHAKLPYLNKTIIVGNLVHDPELRYTTANVPVANFRIASNKRYRDNRGTMKEEVCYVGIVAWQKLAEACADRLRKGHAVLVEGELQSRVRFNSDGTKKSYIEIRAHHIQFLNYMEDFDKDDDDFDSFDKSGDDEREDGTFDLVKNKSVSRLGADIRKMMMSGDDPEDRDI